MIADLTPLWPPINAEAKPSLPRFLTASLFSVECCVEIEVFAMTASWDNLAVDPRLGTSLSIE
jgi:hypothetical protein